MILQTGRASFLLATILFFGLAVLSQAHAQTSNLYLTGYDNNGTYLYIVRGGNLITQIPESVGGEFAIAVSGDVRTTGMLDTTQATNFNQGAQYGLDGTTTSIRYARNVGGRMEDGTTDGLHNYAASYQPSGSGSGFTGIVYSFDRNWQNGDRLFDSGFLGTVDFNPVSVTCDATNASLWVTSWDSSMVKNFSLDGTVLGSFDLGHNHNRALALDGADNTLWLINGSSFPPLEQWDKSGHYITSQSITGLANQGGIQGGEFNIFQSTPAATPEPGSSALLVGAGLSGVTFLRRRARKTV